MIISGYEGIGKSCLGHNFANVIDLESTPFEKDWDRYAKCAMHYHRQGYLVLISCHKDIRERILSITKGEEFITLVPNIEDKEVYHKRYAERGNTQEFIDLQMNNWEKWLDENSNKLDGENWIAMEKKENLFSAIVRLAKEPNELGKILKKYTQKWIGI